VETGLDYFGARYLSSAQGRWTSPDWSAAPQPVPYAALDDPQSLNLYAYVRNNPLRTADVDGHQEPPPEEEDVERDRDEEPFGREEVKPETPEATQREVPANPAFEQWQNRLTPEQRQSMADRLSPSGCPVLPETEPTGPTMRAAQRDRGGETADTVAGRQAHSDFAATVKQKPGWKSEPSLTDPATGKTVKPDAVSRAGRPVELKPKTPSGQAAGRRQLPKYERATGKKGRVVYYPKNPNDQN
jgi:RHS repeat-associated protein